VGTAHAGFMNRAKSGITWAMPTLQGAE